ncbi:SRPBCC family protein [Streptomyces smyrnaeus]|uniref:SRPBCC family protein n=1 Tax=Streptomyces smyrnaeus TaxID=1387713 RepID=UPI0037B8337A
MWTYEHSRTTTATPAAAWNCYADPAQWPRWDREVARLTLSGPPAAGTRGTLTLHGRPPAPITIVEAIPECRLSTETRTPDGTFLRFTHRIEALAEGARLIHRVDIDGPSANDADFTAAVAAPIPETMRRLAEVAARRR